MSTTKWLAAIVLGGAVAAVPSASQAGVVIGISIAPPALPVYVQPPAPAENMIWTPGYWQWDASVGDYFWVPGTWVAAPQPGLLWTPGYWGFNNGYYGWNAGYWGPHIGYYGGVNYGFGFFGVGFTGGYWNSGHFFYNTACSNVNVNVIHNTYVHNTTIINNTHVSYVGGQGGLRSQPTQGELAAAHEQHVPPTQGQVQRVNFAQQNRGQFAQQNHGVPQAAALAHPVNSAQGFNQAAMPARAAGGTFNPGANNAQRGFTNNGQQGRGFAATQPTNRPANTLNNNAAVNNRGVIGQQNVQVDRQNVQQQRMGDQQQVMQQRQQNQQQAQQLRQQQFQQRQQDNQQAQQLRQQQQTQRLQDRQQVQQQRQQDRQQVQQQRQEARPAGGGGHEERPR